MLKLHKKWEETIRTLATRKILITERERNNYLKDSYFLEKLLTERYLEYYSFALMSFNEQVLKILIDCYV